MRESTCVFEAFLHLDPALQDLDHTLKTPLGKHRVLLISENRTPAPNPKIPQNTVFTRTFSKSPRELLASSGDTS